MHDETTGLGLLDATRLQVEQLLGVEASGGGGGSGATDIAVPVSARQPSVRTRFLLDS